MELVVFDLDGTLLNSDSTISPYTRDTLVYLAQRGIAYTVATGRTLHAARDVMYGHEFGLPQVFKNGVMIWTPNSDHYDHTNFLQQQEIQHVLEAVLALAVTPFLFTLEPGNRHGIYHAPLQTDVERRLADDFARRSEVKVLPLADIPAMAEITNISALGEPDAIDAIAGLIATEAQLVAYCGIAMEGAQYKWIDIHHRQASKGGAITLLREQLGVEKVVCFGDGDNDLSMFAIADESYAPANAATEVKLAATATIGHHNEDGIARFLRERFELPAN